MGRSSRLLLWLGAAAPSLWNPKITALPSRLEPGYLSNPLGTAGPWVFSTCGASGRRGPTQAQCDRAYAGSSVVVSVEDSGPLRGVQLWRAPSPGHYLISAYGAAGGKGAQSHLPRAHGVFVSAVFSFSRGEPLFILVGQQGADACPGGSPESQLVCLGESGLDEEHAETEATESGRGSRRWAGGGGGGGGATYVFRQRAGELEPLLVAAGGGGRAYLKRQVSGRTQANPERLENRTEAPGSGGRGGAAGGGGGWTSRATSPQAGRSLHEGAEGGQGCAEAWATLSWAAAGGFGGGGGACTAGGGGGGYRGGDASSIDVLWADGEDGVSFVHPSSELYLQPLAVMESHGEVEIRRHPSCSHCPLKDCQWQAELQLAACVCPEGMKLAEDNITCTDLPRSPSPVILMVVVTATLTLSLLMVCGALILVSQKKCQDLWRTRLPDAELELSKLRTCSLRTAPNSYYCQVGLGPAQSWPFGLPEVSPTNVTLLSALGCGAFGEVYQGLVTGLPGQPSPLQVAVKALRKLCSPREELDFLMEVHIISKLSHQNIVRCVGLSFQAVPRLILLELMSGGDMKTFLMESRPNLGKPSPLAMQDLLQLAQDIAQGCHYLEENHFIHRDIAARNCLLSCTGPGRVAKIGDFGMARNIYRCGAWECGKAGLLGVSQLFHGIKTAGCFPPPSFRDSYYRRGGPAFLPVKWMPPEALLEGIFTSKTDSWSFGVLLWEIFSLGYMPYPGRTNLEVLDFVIAGSRMDAPQGCPEPVYRIMTQCWQHRPELRPTFASILQHLQDCTQDPEVLNSPLLLTVRPTLEEEGASELGNRSLEGPRSLQPQDQSPKTLKNWEEGHLGCWLSSGLEPLKPRGFQPQNLWNPTYGS
ncbi:leukocyte tyrosine kinase receptor isoform X2 [Cavia porcellus]|uniref:leukocyte tyrosine kinase receptor isoform X2 n=1 Tax=Cavia porcellus TaxID=10141 RepID=UPI002FE05BDB